MNAIAQIKRKQIEEIKSTPTRIINEAEIQSLFGLERPLNLNLPLSVREQPHAIAPAIKDHHFDPELLRRTILSRIDGEPLMLLGDKGTGKTSFVEQLHARLGLPLLSINGGPGVDEDYLFGRAGFDGNAVTDLDGLLSYGIRHGISVCVDELSAIPAKVLLSMNDVLEQGEVIVLKHHGIDPSAKPEELLGVGRNVIVRHPGFRFIATDNTGGKTIRDSRFNGSGKINGATRSRFTYLNVNHMPREAEKAVLENVAMSHWRVNGLSGADRDAILKPALKTMDAMMDFAERFRTGFSQEETLDTISLRELKRWVRKFMTYGSLDAAFEDAVYSGLEESDQSFSHEVYLECFGTSPELLLNASLNYGDAAKAA